MVIAVNQVPPYPYTVSVVCASLVVQSSDEKERERERENWPLASVRLEGLD